MNGGKIIRMRNHPVEKRRDPRVRNTAKGMKNPRSVAGSEKNRSGPVVQGSPAGSGTPLE
jgi:hypothetical protein